MKSLLHFKITVALLLISFASPFASRAQPTNPPSLSVTGGSPPALTLFGTPGASYQVQFTAQFPAANGWAALTNLQLSNSTLLFQDGTVQQGAARFYRALVINSNTFLGYVPPQLAAGEMLQYITDGLMGGETTNTLLVLSPTNGLFLTSGNVNDGTVAGVYSVAIQYMASNLFTAGISLIFPSGVIFPSIATTNLNTMLFTGTNEGTILDFGTGPIFNLSPTYGTFQFNTSLVGQVAASSQLHEGEVWRITTYSSLGGSTNTGTLVVESATNGWWIGSGNAPSPALNPVSVQITPQTAFSSLLSVVFPSGQNPSPTTNIYVLYFTSLNFGQVEVPNSPGGSQPLGLFVRNTSFVGQTLAPSQLVTGDQVLISNAPNTPSQTLLMDSTNAWWFLPSDSSFSGITNVLAQFNPIGAMSGELVIADPGVSTNTCLLVFTNTDSGASQSPFPVNQNGPQIYSIGSFSLNTNLVGQTLAPAQLAAGQSYAFPSSAMPGPGSEIITIISATNTLWTTTSPETTDYVLPLSTTYNQLGLFAGILTVVAPPNTVAGSGTTTNVFSMLFTSATNGWYQQGSVPFPQSPGQLAQFTLNTNLVGQTFAPVQLSQGDSYQFAQTNSIFPDLQATLIMTSSITADWIQSIGETNFQSGQVQYNPLGPIAANLSVILSASYQYPSGVTNDILLLFNSSSNGLFMLTNYSSSGQIIGTFTNSAP